MQQIYGALITDAQVDPLLDYLVKNYGAELTNVAKDPKPALPAK